MKRVWIVENAVPVQALTYVPPFVTNEGVRYLLEQRDVDWEDEEVKQLCESLSSDEYELTVLASPEQMRRQLRTGIEPPHAVIFDWEGPGFGEQVNCDSIADLLTSSFSYVQVYTHLGAQAVEPKLEALRAKFVERLLPTRGKNEVSAAELRGFVTTAWNDTIAGDTADRVRSQARAAVERMLIDLCSIKREALAALVKGESGEFLALVMAKLRDEIGSQSVDQLSEVLKLGGAVQATDELRRFQSIFYYHFPSDDLVRTGDLVIDDAGKYAMVFTPQCHLERFQKKTGGRLTVVETDQLSETSVKELRASGLDVNSVGNSSTASHGKAGYSLVLLPNVPKTAKNRNVLVDLALRTHCWRTIEVPGTVTGALTYTAAKSLTRLCTITETFGTAIVSHVANTIASAGVPDFPNFEIDRLMAILKKTT